MKRSPPFLALPLIITLSAASSSAQSAAKADALFKSGMEAMKQGDFKTGCFAIGESYRIDPLPGALFNLAECHAKAGNIATAVAKYEEYLRVFEGLPGDQKEKQRAKGRDVTAMAQVAALKPTIPEVTLVLPSSAPLGTTLTLDGIPLGRAALNAALPLDPGEHHVTTRAPDGPVMRRRFTLGLAEKKRIELEVNMNAPAVEPTPSATPAPVEPTPVSPAPRRRSRKAPKPAVTAAPAAQPGRGTSTTYQGVMIAAWSLGAAGLATSLVTGGLALGKQDAIQDGCFPTSGGRVACRQIAFDAVQSARSLELASTVAFAAGIAGLATGTILLIAKPKASAPRGAPLSVGLGASVAITCGSSGAMIVKGAW